MGRGRVEVLVIGAGLTGLSTAYHLEHQGHTDHVIVERESRPGGWAKTEWTGAWGADRAIHVLYFRDDGIRDWVAALLDHQWARSEKDCIIDSGGVRTPFPFHANLFGREPGLVEECLQGLVAASAAQRTAAEAPVTFADWIDRAMGAGVDRHFMQPYNTKMWTVPPSEMGCDWMGGFIPSVDLDRILTGSQRRCNSEIGANSYFHYPYEGISAVAERLSRQITAPVRYATRVVGVDLEERRVVLSDGDVIDYEWLVSTMPLPSLIDLAAEGPPAVAEAAACLESVDLVLADVGFRGRAPYEAHWVYLPDRDVLAHRFHLPHLLSPRLAPRDHGLYCVEISHSRHRPLPAGSLRERVVGDLVRTGWLKSAEDVVFFRERRFPHAYALPRVGFRAHAETVRRWLDEHQVISTGRYGEWTYANMEDALVWGRSAASRLADVPDASLTW